MKVSHLIALGSALFLTSISAASAQTTTVQTGPNGGVRTTTTTHGPGGSASTTTIDRADGARTVVRRQTDMRGDSRVVRTSNRHGMRSRRVCRKTWHHGRRVVRCTQRRWR